MNEPAIAVIGDGKMGRTIAQMVQERGWHLTAMLDAEHNRGAWGLPAAHSAILMWRSSSPNPRQLSRTSWRVFTRRPCCCRNDGVVQLAASNH